MRNGILSMMPVSSVSNIETLSDYSPLRREGGNDCQRKVEMSPSRAK
jgi:hypothetical protein